jgi:hypothetical protein
MTTENRWPNQLILSAAHFTDDMSDEEIKRQRCIARGERLLNYLIDSTPNTDDLPIIEKGILQKWTDEVLLNQKELDYLATLGSNEA